MTKSILIDSIPTLQAAIRDATHLRISGGQSKRVSSGRNALTTEHVTTERTDPSSAETVLDMTGYSGVLEYDPSEFTMTARAGTRLADIRSQLQAHGQFIPFDPPLADQGATLGGTIAAGISGPTRLRFGGVRDFVIGIKMVDGTAAYVTGGGKVVKNAAGFDTPKLMVGSWGELGVLTEITLKVFPQPREYCTVRIAHKDVMSGLRTVQRLAGTPIDLDGLDLDGAGTVLARVGGLRTAVLHAADRIAKLFEANVERIDPGDDECACWTSLLEWQWQSPSDFLVRVPLTPARIAELDAWLASHAAQRRYSVAGNVAWIGWPGDRSIGLLDEQLSHAKLGGRILRGPSRTDSGQPIAESNYDAVRAKTRLGFRPSELFARKIKQALDPNQRFAERV